VHPVVVLVPALALILGPRLWVGHVLKQHNRRDLASARRAGDLARELLDKNQLQGRILWACSLTYVASSLVAVLQFWPWIGRPPPALPIITGPDLFLQGAPKSVPARKPAEAACRIPFGVPRYSRRKGVVSLIEALVRPIGKPLIRLWLRVADAP
jgi:hypothetical protein